MRRLLNGILALIVGVLTGMAQAPAPAKILVLVGGEYHDYDALPKTLVQRLRDRLQDSVAAEFTITKDVGAFRSAAPSIWTSLPFLSIFATSSLAFLIWREHRLSESARAP